jgi:hypothetical protein
VIARAPPPVKIDSDEPTEGIQLSIIMTLTRGFACWRTGRHGDLLVEQHYDLPNWQTITQDGAQSSLRGLGKDMGSQRRTPVGSDLRPFTGRWWSGCRLTGEKKPPARADGYKLC